MPKKTKKPAAPKHRLTHRLTLEGELATEAREQTPAESEKSESTKDPNEALLLKQIRDDFAYVREYWRESHDEAAKDMNLVACIPPADFAGDRKGRPVIWPDEISQYVKQSNNNLRQNKRSIKVSPRAQEAKDVDAENRQAYIRGIEYASKASSIYTTGYESAVECGFGFWRIKLVTVSKEGHQEPRLKRIPNWATVYPDPDAEEADFSDQSICFAIDRMRTSTFTRKYPRAKKRSFTGADAEMAPNWLQGDNIVVAEYWTRENLSDDKDFPEWKVTQRITNGFEVLEENEWIGDAIPIVGVFGEEIYVKDAEQSKRVFMSLIRRARGPQTMLAYVASQEAEEFGMMPRAPLQGYKGQFDPNIHKNINKEPRAYLEFGLPANWNMNWGPPPLPSRVQFQPNIQAYEIAFERWRRSVMSAMGLSPLPTAAQRQNEKSGIALEKIQNQEATGAFHFTDNFTRALENTGRQLNHLITKLAELDSLPEQLLGKDQKDEDVTLHVVPRGSASDEQAGAANGAAHDPTLHDEELPEGHVRFFAHRGEFEISVSDGPSYQSQREEASSFADELLATVPKLGLPPQITQQMLAIAVKLKNIGTLGDELADLLSPPDANKLPPQVKALVATIQANAQQQVQALTQELQKLQLEKAGKVVETQGKLMLQEHDRSTRMAEADKDRLTKLAVAEISTKAQDLNQRLTLLGDVLQQLHDQAHDYALSLEQHSQAKELQSQQAETAMAQQQAAQQAQAQQAAATQSSGADSGAGE